LLVGIVIGLLLGLGIALAVAIYLYKGPGPFASKAKSESALPAKQEPGKPAQKAKAEESAAKTAEKPRFDFYSILPGEDAAKDAAKEKAAKDVARPAPVEVKETFYLQAGAFQGAGEADNMRASLALLGIEANVQASTTADRGQLHRVRIGPFTRVEDVNRVRDTLKQNGFETTLIKAREAR
jgi:cell division protein FtsN